MRRPQKKKIRLGFRAVSLYSRRFARKPEEIELVAIFVKRTLEIIYGA